MTQKKKHPTSVAGYRSRRRLAEPTD